MKGLHDYGALLLGSRLKKVSEALYAGVDEVYRAHGVDLPSRCFPILFLLRDDGPLGITELAARLGQSHPAVSQMSRKLLAQGVVEERADPADERRRLLALSDGGRALMGRLGPVWRAVAGAVEELAAATGADFLGALTALDARLGERPFARRIQDRLRRAEDVEVIPFEARYRGDFKRLNVAWLEKHFYVEAIDDEVLSNPERAILEPGGQILLARLGEDIVGTCALIKAEGGDHDRFELSKMAVDDRFQGLGLGRKLLEAAVAAFQASGARELFLESNRKLKPAIRLYETSGFVHAPRPEGASHYQRADVYMVYRG